MTAKEVVSEPYPGFKPSHLPRRHCCLCIKLPDGVLLVGIYGLSVHLGLLLVQGRRRQGGLTQA